jgi:signal transduction histidine kinase
MGGQRPRVSERTLALSEGFPQLSPVALAYTVRRATLSVLAVTAFVIAMIAMATTLGGHAVAGVDAQNPGGSVLTVSTTGFAWRDGIRAGQSIVALDDTQSPGGWRIETIDEGGTRFTSASAGWDEALGSSSPLAAAALLVGLLSLVFVRTHRRWVAGAAIVAIYLGSVPLQLQGNPLLSTTAMALAAAVPGAWLATRLGSRWLRAVSSLALAVGVLAWAASRLSGSPAYEALETVRATGSGFGAALVVLAAALPALMRRQRVAFMRPALVELLAIAALAAAGAVLVVQLQLPPLFVVIACAPAVVGLPRLRRLAARRLEDALLADVRQHVALEASEAERARLAHELHDVPLQHLTSVIRRLEVVPEARDETETLREIAEQLRETATNLRPPVLDDLGLGAALEFLVSRAADARINVSSGVADACGPFPGARPPADVELAVFRIAQEAVANAMQHSGASAIRIEGSVGRDEIIVAVRDDGHGLDGERLREASRRGRLGLASMRRRAEAVDADLSINGAAGGTTVKVRWQR